MKTITTSIEGLVAAQLRLDQRCSGQQCDISRIRTELTSLRELRAQITELRELRQHVSELRAAVDDRDSRISHLEAQIAELLALANRAPPSRPSAPISLAGDGHLASGVAGPCT